jgi:LysR family hydrogen peroxide-inducible transcriptional activator
MNFNQLEYIIAVDRYKNFSRAADACHITQATLSAMVKKLEEELDINIFDRKTNPISTTDAGQIIIDAAKKVLIQVQLLSDKAKNIKGKIAGRIRIGIIPTIAGSLLPKIIMPIMEKYPDLELEIHEITTQNIVKQLTTGQIDIGILATPLNIEELEENILYYEALMVYGNFEEDKQYIMPEEIREHKIWLLEEGNCLRDQFIKLCHLKKNNQLPHNLKFEASSFESLLCMVDNFSGLTLIPELYYQTLSEEKKKKVRNFKSPVPVREVSLVFYPPYAKHKIIEVLTAEIKGIVNKNLISNNYKKTELVIAKM